MNPATGFALAGGLPCVNDASSLEEAAAFVHARAVGLIVKALDEPAAQRATPATERQPLSFAHAAKAVVRHSARSVVRRIFKALFNSPQWRIGYRFVEGDGVLETGSLGGVPWQVLPNAPGHFYADPFPIEVDGRHHVFFEDLKHGTDKGIISCVTFGEDGTPGPVTPVLEEPHHLSYPFVIADGGEIYMLPEQSQSNKLVLYRATAFPHRWVPDAVLLEGPDVNDASVVRHDGRYWMFATTRDGASPSDMLTIHHAATLKGPWVAHAANPIFVDRTSARPAGPLTHRDSRLWRVAQNGTHGYGTGLALAEVTALTAERVEQRVDHYVFPSPEHWNGRRLHTLARAGRLECIDGDGLDARYRFLRRLTAAPAVRRWIGRG